MTHDPELIRVWASVLLVLAVLGAGCLTHIVYATDATVPYPGPVRQPWPNPQPRIDPMPNTQTHELDVTVVGDLDQVPAEPILEPPADLEVVDVIVNVRHARTPNGHHAIRIQGPNTLTAAQAHQLHIDLDVAAAWVSGLRGDAGYTS